MIFDAHFHIIDPNYPLIPNQGFLPDPFAVEDYFNCTSSLDIQGGAIVSGSFQGFDQSYLIAALNKMGKHFVGVTQLPITASDDEIKKLYHYGIRALRFNLFRGTSENIKDLVNFAIHVYELVGWHVEFYVDSSELKALSPMILNLPKVSLDHLGLSQSGFTDLLKLVEKGIKVKASGFMRVDFDVEKALLQIYQVNSNALMFGTDLPGTRTSRQFSIKDLELIKTIFPNEAAENILWNNAKHFYLDR